MAKPAVNEHGAVVEPRGAVEVPLRWHGADEARLAKLNVVPAPTVDGTLVHHLIDATRRQDFD